MKQTAQDLIGRVEVEWRRSDKGGFDKSKRVYLTEPLTDENANMVMSHLMDEIAQGQVDDIGEIVLVGTARV